MFQDISSRQGMTTIIALSLAGIAAARIVSTYQVFSETSDEPAHVLAGMEWLARGTYTFEYLHPPLARVAVALGPFLDGVRPLDEKVSWKWGNEILYARGRYSHNLALARLGVLPFFLLATLVVYAWSRRLFGNAAAALAVLIFTTLPPILAHSGLATTDMPLTATFLAALSAFTLWLEQPTILRSWVLGLTAGLAVLTKFSAVLFLPASGLAILGCRWVIEKYAGRPPDVEWRRRLVAAGAAAITAGFVIWAGYRFSVSAQPFNPASKRPHVTVDRFLGSSGVLHAVGYFVNESVPLPAPGFFAGLRAAAHKDREGTRAYLLGRVRQGGWWYFFLVALAFKSPLPFLILAGIGLTFLIRQSRSRPAWRPLALPLAVIAILFVTMPVRINLGLRHVLPVYPLLAIVAAFGATTMWNAERLRRLGRAGAVVLLGWQVTSSARIHPDYLAYFNELAGSNPERILVDSDLDWGQDVLRLSDALRSRGVDALSIACFCNADLSKHNLPPYKLLLPHEKTTGWIAISMFDLKEGGVHEGKQGPLDAYSWLEAYEPVALVGRSIRLYYISRLAHL